MIKVISSTRLTQRQSAHTAQNTFGQMHMLSWENSSVFKTQAATLTSKDTSSRAPAMAHSFLTASS